jgi:hypothetical protein
MGLGFLVVKALSGQAATSLFIRSWPKPGIGSFTPIWRSAYQ